MKSVNEKKHKKNTRAILISVLVLVLVAGIVLSLIFIPGIRPSSAAYKALKTAIENAESLTDFVMDYSTTQKIEYGGVEQDIVTAGHILVMNDKKDVVIEINTESMTLGNSDKDSKVSVTLYSDGDGVYDISTGKKQSVDITSDEFDEILDNFSLYKYAKKNVRKEQFANSDIEGEDGQKKLTVNLKSPEDAVLKAYAQEISDITGEDVKPDDLEVVAAYVDYDIYGDVVKNQSYIFTVQYVTKDAQTLKYTVDSSISYITDFSEEEYDEYMPLE